MKVIKYQMMTEVNHGTEEYPDIVQTFYDVTLGWSEANEEIAKAEAYNGEYTIEDDGEPEPETEPSTDDRIAALESENKTLKAQVFAQSEQMDFYEECIAEMASVVYA